MIYIELLNIINVFEENRIFLCRVPSFTSFVHLDNVKRYFRRALITMLKAFNVFLRCNARFNGYRRNFLKRFLTQYRICCGTLTFSFYLMFILYLRILQYTLVAV